MKRSNFFTKHMITLYLRDARRHEPYQKSNMMTKSLSTLDLKSLSTLDLE